MLAKLFERQLPLSGIGANETTGISIYDWAKMFSPGAQVTYGGNRYQAYQTAGTGVGGQSYINNATVFAPANVRIMLFAEGRFLWQQLRNGQPGDYFSTPELRILETPWPGHSTSNLLALAEMDILCAGNSYWVRNADRLQRLDPKFVKILTAKVSDAVVSGYEIGEELIGYAYVPDKDHVTIYEPVEVCHYKPHPSPTSPFLGLSWLNPCLPDIQTDQAVAEHKKSVLENGALLSTIVSFDPSVSREAFEGFVDKFHRQHEGSNNAGKTLFLGGGADVKTVGQTFENLAVQSVQNAGETRVAACAGVPSTIVGFSEGMKGSALNAGNYGQSRRRLADITIALLWREFATSMQSLLTVPGGSRLWYDDRNVRFMREDLADQANIDATNAKTVLLLIQAGYKPDSAVQAVLAGDFARLLGQHTGLTSVQLQPPMDGEQLPTDGQQPSTNGKPVIGETASA